MTIHFGFCDPPSQALKEYAAELYARRNEGVIVPRRVITFEGWMPLANQCHDNAFLLAQKSNNFTVVNGWLYFDLCGQMPFVRFAAHSVVQDIDGNLIDITPVIETVPAYPFICTDLSEGDFEDAINLLISAYGSSNCLDHCL